MAKIYKLKLYKGTCDCHRTSILAKGLVVETAATEKEAARLLKRFFTSGRTHYIVHYKGQHVLFGYIDGHWYPPYKGSPR